MVSAKKCLMILVCILLIGIVGCSQETTDPGSTDNEPENEFMVMMAGKTGSSPFLIVAAAMDIFSKEIPEYQWRVEPGGATANIIALQNKQSDFIIANSSAVYNARKGEDPFNEPHEDVRALIALYPTATQIFALKSAGINEIEDLLNGVSFSPSIPGQFSYDLNMKILEAYGMSFESIEAAGGKIEPLDWTELTERMQDGAIQVSSWNTTAPTPNITEISLHKDLVFISIPDDMRDKILSEEYCPELSKITIPAGTYKLQDYPVHTVGAVQQFNVHADLDEDVAYRMAKALWENRDHLVSTYSGMEYITEDTAASGFTVPLHPGAKRYYQEMGIKTD